MEREVTALAMRLFLFVWPMRMLVGAVHGTSPPVVNHFACALFCVAYLFQVALFFQDSGDAVPSSVSRQ